MAPLVKHSSWPGCSLLLRLLPMASMSYNKRVSTRELIEKELDELPEALQREVYNFACFLRSKSNGDSFNGLSASEAVLARDWDTPDEDEAWANL